MKMETKWLYIYKNGLSSVILGDILKIGFKVILYDLATGICGNKFKSRVILQSYKILNTAYHFKMMCSAPCREQMTIYDNTSWPQLSDKATV